MNTGNQKNYDKLLFSMIISQSTKELQWQIVFQIIHSV